MVLTSCDPLKDEGKFAYTNYTAENLLNGATFAQFDGMKDDAGNLTYTPSETGNYIQFDLPHLSAVTIYYINKKGEKKTLSYGRPAGMFYYLPARGSEPLQTLYFEYLDEDGKEVTAEKQFTLKVAQELEPAVKILVSNAGVKKWRWMPTDSNGGAVWGNGGYLAGAQEGGITVNGAWWGCGVEDGDCGDKFSGQTQHAGSRYDEIKGECYALSYMEFNEDGSLTAYSNEGVAINKGSFSISGYNNNEIVNADTFSRGTLETSEGAILWPFAINTGGLQPTKFDVGYLDAGRMVLIYAAEGTGAWGECTWWSFMSDDDAPASLPPTTGIGNRQPPKTVQFGATAVIAPAHKMAPELSTEPGGAAALLTAQQTVLSKVRKIMPVASMMILSATAMQLPKWCSMKMSPQLQSLTKTESRFVRVLSLST